MTEIIRSVIGVRYGTGSGGKINPYLLSILFEVMLVYS